MPNPPSATTSNAPPIALPASEMLPSNYFEKTLNCKGFMFTMVSSELQLWLSSLPSSPLPLLDAGAAYGVHTLHALRSGRDVIALDAEPGHLSVLRSRVAELPASPSHGKLVRTVAACLPAGDAIPPASVSGVLLSEVTHFLVPGEPQALFRDVHSWLAPGGKFVAVGGAYDKRLHTLMRQGFKLREGRSVDEVRSLLEGPAEELLNAAPGYMEMPMNKPFRGALGDHFYLMSVKEMAALARSAGFEVERVEDVPGKYRMAPDPNEPESVLLVARKQLGAVSIEG